MPRIPIDYSKTIIYKLVHNEDYDNANIYIGSTTDFVKRKNAHKNCCNTENSRGYNDKRYQYIRENGGWNCFNMIEVEKYPCNDGNEARAREEYWRCLFNAQLNVNRAYRTEEEKKEQDKKRYEQNRDKLLKQYKKYNEKNKDKILEQKKGYYEQNKDKIIEYEKQYRKKIITCECGCIITQGSLSKHQKSQKHLLLTKQIKYEFVDDNDDN